MNNLRFDINLVTKYQYAKPEQETENQIIIVTLSNNRVFQIPITTDNEDYVEIKKLIDAGTITIQDAD